MEVRRSQPIIPPPEPPNRRALFAQAVTVGIILLVTVILVAYLIAIRPVNPDSRLVTFRIEGSAGQARISYSNPDGTTTGPLNASVPWQVSGLRFRAGSYVILTAGTTTQTGTIRCTLLLDGVEWKKESTLNPDGKVACAGLVP